MNVFLYIRGDTHRRLSLGENICQSDNTQGIHLKQKSLSTISSTTIYLKSAQAYSMSDDGLARILSRSDWRDLCITGTKNKSDYTWPSTVGFNV